MDLRLQKITDFFDKDGVVFEQDVDAILDHRYGIFLHDKYMEPTRIHVYDFPARFDDFSIYQVVKQIFGTDSLSILFPSSTIMNSFFQMDPIYSIQFTKTHERNQTNPKLLFIELYNSFKHGKGIGKTPYYYSSFGKNVNNVILK